MHILNLLIYRSNNVRISIFPPIVLDIIYICTVITRLSAKGTDEVMEQAVFPHKMCYNGHGLFGKLQQPVEISGGAV